MSLCVHLLRLKVVTFDEFDVHLGERCGAHWTTSMYLLTCSLVASVLIGAVMVLEKVVERLDERRRRNCTLPMPPDTAMIY